MKLIFSSLLLSAEAFIGGRRNADGKLMKFPNPLGYEDGYKYDFDLTETESAAGFDLTKRCGQPTIAGSPSDQRNDKNCPNVLLINTDDMAWGDLSINNPSKLVPTPNLDRLVSKGINFRDGHACTSRCAPSRYCLMTGRYHFRRGDYHYKPMVLEYGRKILPQLFKRNNYHTMVVGKPQPVEAKADMKTHFFVEGTRFWGYDKSFTSRSYCCRPGGGYFEDDIPYKPFNKWAIFTEWRDEDERSLWVQDSDIETDFFNDQTNWHFLDGYYDNGNPANEKVKNSYKAYWTAIANNTPSGLNRRRRRDTSGKIIRRFTRQTRNRRDTHKLIDEVVPPKKGGRQNYLRFMEKTTGKVIVANYRLKGMAEKHVEVWDRSNYEFAVNRTVYDTKKKAENAKKIALAELLAKLGSKTGLYNDMEISVPKLTQVDFDSREIMHRFHSVAIDYLKEHVDSSNPPTTAGLAKEKNQPFFLYLSFRAPHRPYSHNLTFDADKPTEYYPHAAIGKPGEQLVLFDEYVGNVMKTLHDLKVADNTFIIFTSDNGPDIGAFKMANRFGHLRMATMRGKKASIYEGGHRVPFLTWWPLGTHRSLWGTNYDLPVGHVDLFATFADILNYTLPTGDKCIYAYNSENAPSEKTISEIGRPTKLSGEAPRAYCKRVKAGIDASGNGTYVGTDSGYTTTVQLRMSTGMSDYLLESQDFGYENVETWETKEEQTGFLLGWDGCMAEDSQSFKAAFEAEKIGQRMEKGKEIHQFKNKLDKVPSKIFAGKLGDLSLRLGRYKLVRFNPPKDLRTGPSRQHLINHQGPKWEKLNKLDPDSACKYDKDGTLQNPGCDEEQYCREHTTFGNSFCMRDHYYQLWDLEKNFGEKTLCNDNVPDKLNANKNLEKAIMGGVMARKFSAGVAAKPAEKPTDKYGVGCGVESSSVGSYLNDCCVLNLDEKQDFLRAIMRQGPGERKWNPGPKYNCRNMTFKRFGEIRTDGGVCKEMKHFKRMAGDTWEKNQAFFAKFENRFLNKPKNYATRFNWTTDYFKWPKEGEWTPGFACGMTKTGFPDDKKHSGHEIWDEDMGKWRTMTIADRFCWEGKDGAFETTAPPATTESTAPTDATATTDATGTTAPPGTQTTVDPVTLQPVTTLKPFKLGCKVPEHDGPLGEGWAANPKWKDTTLSGRNKPGVDTDDIDPNDFGDWYKFARCMKNALLILEGQAYYPEIKIDKVLLKTGYVATSYPESKPWKDDGTEEGMEMSDDKILAGRKVGDSKMAKANTEELWKKVKNDGESETKRFHGGGSRFIESNDGSDSIVGRCAKFIPDGEAKPYIITPNFDIEMSGLGWYETAENKAQSGGGSNGDVIELTVDRYESGEPVYKDNRNVQRYYDSDSNGAYLYKFSPQYHPSY